MSRRASAARARARVRGGVSTETLVITAAVAAALGLGLSDDGALRELLDTLREAYRRFAYAISLP